MTLTALDPASAEVPMAANRSLSPDPVARMGVYKRFDDVPDRYRLNHHADAYAGRDVWEEFLLTYLLVKYNSETFQQRARRAGRHWSNHMETRGRHHALATPDDVEAWCIELLERLEVTTAYNEYWVCLERFYTWLQWHTDHPHTYQPFLMAAAESDAAQTIWKKKISAGGSA